MCTLRPEGSHVSPGTAEVQWNVRVTACVSVAPATSLAACAGSATRSTLSPPAPGAFLLLRHQHHDGVGGHHPGADFVVGGSEDVDDVAGPDEVQEPGVGQMQRHDAGVRSRCQLGQSRPEQSHVGQHLAATGRTGERRADDCVDGRPKPRREPLRPSAFRAAHRRRSVRCLETGRARLRRCRFDRRADRLAAPRPRRGPRGLRPRLCGRPWCASSPAASHG